MESEHLLYLKRENNLNVAFSQKSCMNPGMMTGSSKPFFPHITSIVS